MYQLHCLGEAALRAPNGNLVHFRSRKHFALLVYLALNADRAHRRERLVHLLWSDSDSSKARHSLSQALYAVRRLLNGAVHIEGEDLEIKSEGLQVDALELERLLQCGDSEAAAELYRGEFLEGFWVRGAQGFEEWAGHERARVGALARDALRSALKTARDRCDWVEARRQAERLVQLDPFDEAAYGELMRSLWMMGDRAAALESFEDLKRMLETELDACPSKEIIGLAERIRQRPVRGSWTTRRLLRETGISLFQDPPFVGRKAELAALAQEWDRAAAGESRTVAVTGPAGIGKTRLAEQFIGSLALNDVTTLRGRCYEAEQTLPYGPVAEALRAAIATLDLGEVNPLWLSELARIVPEVHSRFKELPQPSVLDAEGSRRRLYEGIAQVVSSACEIRPVLLFIDDAHWADDSSFALLHYLHRRVTNGLYLLTAHRPEELEPRADLATTDFLTGHSPRVRSLSLEGLGHPASSALLLSLMGEQSDELARATLLELSGGNPFFAIELVREFAESDERPSRQLRIPESIKALLNRRFAGLEERSTAVLEQAACLGTRVTVEVLSSAVGLPPVEFSSELRELSRAAILVEEDGSIRFRHNLLREVAWSRVPVVLRGALHLRASRALIKTGGSDGEIALHLLAAGERRRAHRHALRGADAAEGVFALEEVAELLQLAIETAPQEQTRIDLVGRLGRVFLHMRDYAKARPLLEERLENLSKRKVDLDLFEARADLLFLDMYSSTTKVEESSYALRAFFHELQASKLNAKKLEAEILGKLLWAAARSFNPRLVDETVSTIKFLDGHCTQPEVRCRTSRSLGIYECYSGNLAIAERHLRDALALANEAGDEAAVVDCYVGLTTLVPRKMSSDLAEYVLRDGLPIAQQYADPWHVAALLCNCAVCFMYMGNPDRAESLLLSAQSTLETTDAVPDTSPSILYNLGFIAGQRGEFLKAETFWTKAEYLSERDGVLSVRAECIAALGKLRLQAGDITGARRLAAKTLRLTRRAGVLTDDRMVLEELLARLRYESGHAMKALRQLARTAESSRESDTPLFLTARLTHLDIALKENLLAEAQRVAEDISAVAARHDALWWIEQAEALTSRSRRTQRTF